MNEKVGHLKILRKRLKFSHYRWTPGTGIYCWADRPAGEICTAVFNSGSGEHWVDGYPADFIAAGLPDPDYKYKNGEDDEASS